MNGASSISSGPAPDSSPYLGLRPFEAEDASFFFGRSREVELLAANLRTARTSLIYGESGVGKSSLLRAGLGPTLNQRSARRLEGNAEEGETFAAIIFAMSREDPTPALSRQIASATGKAGVSIAPDASVLEAIEAATERVGRLLIVLDQFEEYLGYIDGRSDDRFGNDFARAITRSELPVHFMIAIREDSISRLDRFRARSRELMSNPIRIEPLTADAAYEAIGGPISVYNNFYGTEYTVEPEFEEALIEATRVGMLDLGFGGRGGLERGAQSQETAIEAAYLQLVLQNVWAAEQESNSLVMRVQTFERLGGVAGIVRQHLDGIMDNFSRDDQRVAGAVFRYLVTPSGMKVPYSSWDLSEMTQHSPERIESVLDRLASERVRIVRPLAPSPHGHRRYEIYHDRLADPVLDWRVRSERGGDRTKTFRRANLVAGIISALAATATLIANATYGITGILVGLSVVYFLSAMFPGIVASALDAYTDLFGVLTARFAKKGDQGSRSAGKGE